MDKRIRFGFWVNRDYYEVYSIINPFDLAKGSFIAGVSKNDKYLSPEERQEFIKDKEKEIKHGIVTWVAENKIASA